VVLQGDGYLAVEEAVELTGGRISLQGGHDCVTVVSQTGVTQS
jgi:hypothetical protein